MKTKIFISAWLIAFYGLSGCQSISQKSTERETISDERGVTATSSTYPPEATAEQESANTIATEGAQQEVVSSDESVESVAVQTDEDGKSSFNSQLQEDEILSQSQVIKILKENGYIGGAGSMEVDGEMVTCDFAGKRPSDGAKICIRKDQAKDSWVQIVPRFGSRGFSRW